MPSPDRSHNLEDGQRGSPGSTLPSPCSHRGRTASVLGILAEGEQVSLTLLRAHREGSCSGSIRNTWHTPAPAAPFCMPLVEALGPKYTPRSNRQKGTVPLLLIREWRLLLENYLSQTQTPYLLPFRCPFPLAGAQKLYTSTQIRTKTKTLRQFEASPGLSLPQVQGFRRWREQGDRQASGKRRGDRRMKTREITEN